MTEEEALQQLAAFTALCKLYTLTRPYTPTPQASKAMRAELHRQGLPIPGRR